VRKYHTLLHGIFTRAVRDQLILANPAAHTELPKIISTKMRILTPTEFDRLLEHIPARHQLMVLVAVETGLRWGELVALRPEHLDVAQRLLTVQDVYVEVSRKNSPTGQRMILRHYPKDNEPRARISPTLANHCFSVVGRPATIRRRSAGMPRGTPCPWSGTAPP